MNKIFKIKKLTKIKMIYLPRQSNFMMNGKLKLKVKPKLRKLMNG